MILRRTPAPDIAGCIQLLYASTLFFAVLRALYMRTAMSAVLHALVYTALLALCSVVAWGMFFRKGWALFVGVVISLVMVGAAVADFHVPESARVPAAVLGLAGAALLLLSRGEFAASSSKDE